MLCVKIAFSMCFVGCAFRDFILASVNLKIQIPQILEIVTIMLIHLELRKRDGTKLLRLLLKYWRNHVQNVEHPQKEMVQIFFSKFSGNLIRCFNRWLYAHGVYKSWLWIPLVLGLPNRLDQTMYGEPLVWINNNYCFMFVYCCS